jgi:hypothetical protein
VRTVWLTAAFFLVILAGSIIMFAYTNALYHQLQESLQRIHRAVEEDDWDAASRESEELQKIWARTDASWTPIMDHRHVDQLDESLTRVVQLIKLRRKADLLVEVAVAKRLAKRIKDTEVPSIRNVF